MGGSMPLSADGTIEFGRFRLYRRERTLLADGLKLDLGARAIDVLLALIDAGGTMLSKHELLDRIWPDAIVEENNLQVQVCALRRAFGADRNLIRTVPRHGYRFTGHVMADDRSASATHVGSGPTAPSVANLPTPVGALIGRETDLRKVVELQTSYRLLTLSGPGGIGKTSLALAAAWRLVDHYPDGVRLADLATLADPDLVLPAIVAALDLPRSPLPLLPEHVAANLQSRRSLLVLDNCEHLIEPIARIAEALLHGAPHLNILTTSREPLRAEGECVYPVPALAVPGEEITDTEAQLCHSAVRLFVARARCGGASLQLTDDQTRAISRICRRLDGIPLAIELAAARSVALGVRGVAAGLDDRFRLLTGGRRTALLRHQTLRATLDWSFELLFETERAVLRRLAIFPGGFELEAAKEIMTTTDGDSPDALKSLADLVAKSLVTRDGANVPVRYRLLETTRAYSLEKLTESGELEVIARRHAEYYACLFEQAEAESETRPTDEWLADYSPRIDNVRAALDWTFSPGGDASIGVALTAAAVPLWMHLSLMEECRGRVERALAAIDAGTGRNAHREMRLHAALAQSLMYGRGAVFEIGAIETKALQIAESLDDVEYQLRSIWGLWSFHISTGEQCVALSLAQRFHALAAKRTDPIDRLIGERMIGGSQYYLGDLLSARRHLERVLVHDAALAERWQFVRFQVDPRADARAYLARILWLQGLPDQAMRTAESSVAGARATNHATSLGNILAVAACPIALWVGDLAAAEQYVEMLLDNSTRHALGRWRVFGRCYQGMLVMQRGDVNTGFRLLRTALGEPAAAGSAARLFAFLISAASRHAGQIADGLPAIEEAIMRSDPTEERWLIAELLRVKGETLLGRGAPGAAAEAESHFRQALDWARQQGALSWELRAAASLARLWRDQARSKEARELLAPVYARFTEGFATADLKEAKRLLEELASDGDRFVRESPSECPCLGQPSYSLAT
jgi:predicted ATPase/DNA-binding winged helix-turn-helix (wHTH) protein